MENNISGTKSSTNYLLNKYGIMAKKKFGQNFLVEPMIIDKVIDQVESDDIVVEIGPGLGALTFALANKAKQVIAYEIDEDMVHILKEEGKEFKNLEIIQQDFLTVDLDELFDKYNQKLIFVSNLPYYITSEILLKLLLNGSNIKKVVAMTQKEVADRFIKLDKGKDYNPLQVIAPFYSEVSLLTKVNHNNFMPAPKVDSAILTFQMKQLNENVDGIKLLELIKSAFSQRRKRVLSNLKNNNYVVSEELFAKCKMNVDVRVEQLELSDYINLYKELDL